jgi:N-acetylglucosaminyl-diphospho-decaprenol L-rhamnosyltransferase
MIGSTDFMPKISVIVINYNSGERLHRCLDCLAEQSFTDFETIVVDNASTDDSATAAEVCPLATELIKSKTNLGFATGNNLAARQARGDWLAFLNPDAYAAPDWLETLFSATIEFPFADAFGSTQIDALDPRKLDGAGDAYHAFGLPYRGHFGWPVESLPPDGEVFAPCAAAALYRRHVFEKLGGFEERFFCYGEDVDLAFRLRLMGGRVVQVAGARVLHEGSGITGKRSDFTIYHGHRNRIWTFYRNMPTPLLIGLAPFHIAVNIYLLIRFLFCGVAGAYLRALKDAVGGLPAMSPSRHAIQRSRKISLSALIGELTWSPLKLMRRKADINSAVLPQYDTAMPPPPD